ncbi:MAG: exo-alpha-sialidase, partial [Chlorobi bacterium]|nr:exo-alpha-sialidase [Chlorobiota bacterium]
MKQKYIKQTQNLLVTGLILAILFHLDFFISPIKAQNNDKQILQHNEVQDDAYLPLINPKKSPAYGSSSSVFFTSQVNVDVYGDNIIGDAANEPSIAVDPNNPDFIVIGWRQFDNVSSNFRQAGLAYSDDGGETWHNLPPLEAGIFRSDPVLGSNTEGDFFYNSLTLDNAGNFYCTVFRSHDSGETW